LRNRVAVIAFLILAGGICDAATYSALHYGSLLIDRIVSATTAQTAPAVFQVLREIAEGRSGRLSPDLKRAAGIDAIDTSGFLDDAEVRAYALEKIGDIGSDEAIAYLKALRPEDLPGSAGFTVYAGAKIAYQRALLGREPDPNAQRTFLEGLLQHRSDPLAGGNIFSWALAELCNRGSVISMPIIEKALEKGDMPSNIARIRGCEAEMTIVNSDPDRVKALGSALDSLTQAHTGTPLDTQLLIWATDQLSRDSGKEAQAALQRFVINAAALQGDSDSSGIRDLKGLAQSIRTDVRE
jgi:hypothetical protein